MLGWIYLIAFAAQVFLLIRSCRRKQGAGLVLIANILSIILSCFLLWYFDTLPGTGPVAGWAYFPEVFYSLCAAAAFTVLALVSALCWLLMMHKK